MINGHTSTKEKKLKNEIEWTFLVFVLYMKKSEFDYGFHKQI